MFNFLQKNDLRIRNNVKEELNWDPSITSSEIIVAVKGGIVTLSGSVPHMSEKSSAEKAAQRIGGVKGIADELNVRLEDKYQRSDEEIIQAANNALEWDYQIPEGIMLSSEKGWITLRGEAEWDYQRAAAKDAMSGLLGVRGVTNEISLKSRVKTTDVKEHIKEALKRMAASEGQNINVEIDGEKVTLSGTVNSLAESEQARVAAWSAAGVLAVQNNLEVVH
jgi:osmotically-inducible protein OsmY